MKRLPESWEELLKKQLAGLLPGEAAHEPLRAFPSGSRNFEFKNEGPPRPGAVMILICGDKFPLIRRTENGGVHSGQISLPGGRSEEGEDPVVTALRETEEEIGVPHSNIEILGRLSPFHVIPSHYLVTPVVAKYIPDREPEFAKQDKEVQEIILAPIMDLLSDDAIQMTELNVRGYSISAPHFLLEGHIVWGATAMMLNELRVIMKGSF